MKWPHQRKRYTKTIQTDLKLLKHPWITNNTNKIATWPYTFHQKHCSFHIFTKRKKLLNEVFHSWCTIPLETLFSKAFHIPKQDCWCLPWSKSSFDDIADDESWIECTQCCGLTSQKLLLPHLLGPKQLTSTHLSQTTHLAKSFKQEFRYCWPYKRHSPQYHVIHSYSSWFLDHKC